MPFEEQVIRYMLEMYPLITIDLLVRVTHRIKPHREKDMVSLAAQEWLKQGKAEGIAERHPDCPGNPLRSSPGGISKLDVRQVAPEKLDGMLRRALTTPSPQALFRGRILALIADIGPNRRRSICL